MEADNGIKFIQTLKEKKQEPDLVILDVMMPEMNGIETLRWLHKFHPSQKVVLMSFYQDDMSIQKLLSLGADGYISKSFDVTDMDRI
ncbi:response regulator transcription factor, partial [Acinetobacter baumannii]